MATRHMMIGKETTWGTAVTPTYAFELIREDVQLEPEYIRLITARKKAVNDLCLGYTVVRGTTEIILSYQDIAQLLYHFFGNVTTTGASDPYTHTIPGSSGLGTRFSNTLEIQRDSTALTWRYDGCVITGMQFQFRTNEIATCIVSWVGAAVDSTGTAASPSYLDQDFIKPSVVSVEVGGAAVDATDFNISLNWPVDEPVKLGSTSLAVQPSDNDVFSVTGNFNVIFDDLAEIYNAFGADTEVTQFEVHCPSGSDEDLTFLMDQVKWTQATPHVDGRTRQIQPVTFEAYGTEAGSGDSPIGVVVLNADSDLDAA